MAIASLIISIVAIAAALGSTLYARRIWLIERERDRTARTPQISAVYEDYDGNYPCLEVTNDGTEDLTDVLVELLKPLKGYVPALTSLSLEGGKPGRSVSLGRLAATETKRLRAYRDHPEDQSGEARFYAHCKASDGSTWRVPVKTQIPELYVVAIQGVTDAAVGDVVVAVDAIRVDAQEHVDGVTGTRGDCRGGHARVEP